jgi:hypothetical protein
MASTGKIAEVMFEKTKDSYEHQMQLLNLTNFEKPDPAKMQNANNVVWYPVQQHAPIIDGFDLTGEETGIIEETYPSILGTPANDFIRQRADDLRDMRFWERRGTQSGKRQATELNKRIAAAVALQGSLFFRSDVTSGYEFIAQGQALQNERQAASEAGRCFILNDRDTLTFSGDLAARQTLQGRPADTWETGQIGQNVAEYDVFTGSYLPNLVGGANPATTVTADVSEVPEGGSVDTLTGLVTNVDYRVATIAVTATSSYNVGDKVSFSNSAVTVKALGLADKTNTNQAMTFTIVAIPDSTSVKVFPKPIAEDDPALSTLEAAYANIDTQILSTATMDRLNVDASAKVNLFWDKSAVEVIGGTIPADLFAQYDGMQVIHDTMENGQELYLIYDGQIDSLTFRYRIFTWYGITICNPSNCGVAVTF